MDCRRASRVMAYIEARPEIYGAALETIDLVVNRIGDFYRLSFPDGTRLCR
jgi:hypothetical protein